MIALNLKTNNKAQEQIKEYLENNVSEILANKINNGVKITKDKKSLINKKDLDGFWQFATAEARKTAAKGASGTYVDNDTVFGWAIHYFEENSIEGKLFNEDGTEYKPTPKPKPAPKISNPTSIPTPKPQNKQQSLFDLLEQTPNQTNHINDNSNKQEKIEEIIEEINETQKETKSQTITPVEGKFIVSDKIIQMKEDVDQKINETLTDEQIEKSFDKHTMYILSSILDGKLEIQ
ncbi:MAG: hypothetical protein ACI4R8_03605 [Candidatus Caccovivens sp.]